MAQEPLSSRLRRAKGSHLLKRVLLGMRNAEDTCIQAADRIDELEQENEHLRAELAQGPCAKAAPGLDTPEFLNAVRRTIMRSAWDRLAGRDEGYATSKYPDGFEQYASENWMSYSDEAMAVLDTLRVLGMAPHSKLCDLQSQYERLRLAAANAATVLVGPSDDYEGCQEAIDEIRSLLEPKAS